MVDYYALISPTIEPLAGSSPEERQVVYRRLVDILDQQLRAAEPPRSDKDILREKIELESAIRRIERHVLARQKTKSIITETQQPLAPEKNDPLLAPNEIPIQIPIRRDIPGLSRFTSSAETLTPSSSHDPDKRLPQEAAAFEPPTQEASEEAIDESRLASTSNDGIVNGDETVLSDFMATESAPLSNEKQDDEINVGSALTPHEVPVHPLAPREFFTRPLPASPIEPDEIIAKDHTDKTPSLPKASDPTFENKGVETDQDDSDPTDDQISAQDHSTATDETADNKTPETDSLIAPLPVPEPRAFTPTTGIILAQQKPEPSQSKGLILRILILFLVLLALMAAVAGVAEFLDRNRTSDVATKLTNDTPDTVSSPTKFADRLPAEPDDPQTGAASQIGSPSNDPNSANANRLVTRALFIEEQAGGIGEAKKTEGRVSWKLETLTSSTTGTGDLGVRAGVDLTDAGLTASLLFRKNRDLTSANAYLIEVNFQSVGDAPNGRIRDISLPELRPDEKTRGVTLAGIPVPVSDNVFLIGLNALPADIKRNIELIQKQNWFFIQIRFASGKRALLLFEKGKTGDRVFEDAIQAWK